MKPIFINHSAIIKKISPTEQLCTIDTAGWPSQTDPPYVMVCKEGSPRSWNEGEGSQADRWRLMRKKVDIIRPTSHSTELYNKISRLGELYPLLSAYSGLEKLAFVPEHFRSDSTKCPFPYFSS